MKVLILSCNTGGGHNSCAKAIGAELLNRGHTYETDDALLYVSKGTSRFVSNWHVRFYRYFPKLYNKGYQYAEEHPASFDESSAACRILRRGCKRLRAAILAGGYDAVVCVHLFPALMLTFIQREAPLPVKTMFIATDYTASPSCDRMRLDTCVIPDAALTELFVKNGVSPDTIAPLGIPVRAELYSCLPVQEAKKAAGLDPSHRHLLMMTGSMGCGPMEELTQLLANSLPTEYDVTVACSSNRQLLRRMERKFEDRPNIHIRGYIGNVSAIMDSADLFLTKPGGISTTEAMVKGLPMVLVNVVGGCETPNLEFFVSHGGAATADTPEAIAALCKRLLEHDEERLIMRQSLLAMHKSPAAQAICDCLGTWGIIRTAAWDSNEKKQGGHANMTIVTLDNFEKEVMQAETPVVVDFWASWCGPCMMLAPVMEALEPEVPGVKFCKVNVDDERDLDMEFQIESIPTLLCVKGGKAVKRLVGFREKDALKKELEAL